MLSNSSKMAAKSLAQFSFLNKYSGSPNISPVRQTKKSAKGSHLTPLVGSVVRRANDPKNFVSPIVQKKTKTPVGPVGSPRNLPPLSNDYRNNTSHVGGVALDAIRKDVENRRRSGKALMPRPEVLRHPSNTSSVLASSSVLSNNTPKISPVRSNA